MFIGAMDDAVDDYDLFFASALALALAFFCCVLLINGCATGVLADAGVGLASPLPAALPTATDGPSSVMSFARFALGFKSGSSSSEMDALLRRSSLPSFP